jgi:aryl-alcohol dehydrogenase-like predicted oxidoreductase
MERRLCATGASLELQPQGLCREFNQRQHRPACRREFPHKPRTTDLFLGERNRRQEILPFDVLDERVLRVESVRRPRQAVALKRLKTDYIDLYQIHAADSVTPIEETLRALDTLVSQGKVRYIGCSNWYAWQIMKAIGISEAKNLAKFDTLQAYYSIAGRDLEREIAPLLEDQHTGLLVWSPLAGGLLSGKYSRENQKPEDSRRSAFDFPIVDKERTWRILDVLRPVAQAHEVSVASVALAWVLAKPFVTSVIIGAKRVDQLQQNLSAAELQLTEEEMRRLDEVSALPPEYPGWMIPFQNINRLVDVPRV